jgi:hypothetical protein
MHLQRIPTRMDVHLEPGTGSWQEHSASYEQAEFSYDVPRMLLELPFGSASDGRGTGRNRETSALSTSLRCGPAIHFSWELVARLLGRYSLKDTRATHSRYVAHDREPNRVTRRSTRLESVGRFEGPLECSHVMDSAWLLDQIESAGYSEYAAADPQLRPTFPSKRPTLHRILDLRRRLFPSSLPLMIRPDQVSRGHDSTPTTRN